MLRLLDAVVFTTAIGNADAHGKNISIIHQGPEQIRLAPLYDTVPTMLWPQLRPEAAMSVADSYRMPAITAAHLVQEATRWGLSRQEATARVAEIAERLRDAARQLDLVESDPPLGRLVRANTERLLTT